MSVSSAEERHQCIRRQKLQFARVVDEFFQLAQDRGRETPAGPGLVVGPAFELREVDVKMPPTWCRQLGLPDGATYAAGAKVLCDTLAGQANPALALRLLAHVVASADSDVRDLQPQPSDDSAFSP